MESIKISKNILYLQPLKLTGPEQMAIDLFLLEKSFADKNFHMALRFYTWDGNWLSTGRNQKNIKKKWIQLSKSNKLHIVRRPSGGNAVLHSRGLTYALIWKNPPINKKQSYLKITKWLINGYKKAGVNLSFGDEKVNISNNNCFATSTLADLIDKDRNKYVGSAQFWKKGHLLQHGEMLIEPSRKLWKEVFDTDPPEINKTVLEKDKLINSLKESLIKTWPYLKWYNYKLNSKDRSIISSIAKNNFYDLNHF